MSRCTAFAFWFAFVVSAPARALAADDCPDGWFCDGGTTPHALPPNAPPGPRPARPERPPPPELAPDEVPPFEPPSYPPLQQPDEPTIFVDQQDDAPPPVRYRRRRPFREWGFNLHLEGVSFGNQRDRASHEGMGGIGFAFRYRPLPPVAFEAGVDLVGGTDFQGYSRTEAALLLNTLVFFNPHDLVQLYALGGLGFSRADVTISQRPGQLPFPDHDEHYSYFGGQAGLGIEARVSPSIAFGGDILGLIRTRTDDLSDTVPEFEDPTTHRTTNTSGAGVIRLGGTFYW